MRCEKIRGSHMDAFDMCQLMFKFTCHDRRMPDILVPNWASTGWLMHKACEIAMQDGVKIHTVWPKVVKSRIEIITEEVHSAWPDAVMNEKTIPPLPWNFHQRTLKMLSNFEKMRPFFDDSDKIVTERGFCINLVDDDEEPILFTGRIDLTLHKGLNIHIVDFKSSQPEWEHKKVPPQLLRYALALAIMENVSISKIKVHLFNLESGTIHERVFTSNEANSKIDEMIDKIYAIRKRSPEMAKANVGSHCRTLCAYWPSCPAYQASRRK